MTNSLFTLYNPHTQEVWTGRVGWMRQIIADIADYEPEDLPLFRGGHGDRFHDLEALKPFFGVKKS